MSLPERMRFRVFLALFHVYANFSLSLSNKYGHSPLYRYQSAWIE